MYNEPCKNHRKCRIMINLQSMILAGEFTRQKYNHDKKKQPRIFVKLMVLRQSPVYPPEWSGQNFAICQISNSFYGPQLFILFIRTRSVRPKFHDLLAKNSKNSRCPPAPDPLGFARKTKEYNYVSVKPIRNVQQIHSSSDVFGVNVFWTVASSTGAQQVLTTASVMPPAPLTHMVPPCEFGNFDVRVTRPSR